MKYQLLFKLSIPILLFAGCSVNTTPLTRQQVAVNREVFFGTDSNADTTELVLKLSQDMEKAFSLVPLTRSQADRETRIYYASIRQELFFVQKYQHDSLTVELYQCGTERKNDSLFMRIGGLIKAGGKYDIDKLVRDDMLPVFKDCRVSNGVQHLDKGYIYFIQVKTGKVVKNILMNDNCELVTADKEIEHTKDFIRSISATFNFAFYDPWDKIDSLAFRNK